MQIYRILFGVAIAASLAAQPAVKLALAKPLGDYVPCLFDRDQDASLRAQRTSRRLITPVLAEWELLGYLNGAHKRELATSLSNRDAFDFAAVLEQMQSAGVLRPPAGITTQTLASNLAATSAVLHDLPRDIACSQGMLSWSEAKDAYNRPIADTYLVYQVNVRNLNSQKEFLLQDVQVAVDDGAFVAGRDKIIARGVALQGQVYGRTNTAERLLETIAAFWPTASIFAAGVATGVGALMPDRSADQMTRFNDTSFSASQAYKIVSPRAGRSPSSRICPSGSSPQARAPKRGRQPSGPNSPIPATSLSPASTSARSEAPAARPFVSQTPVSVPMTT